MKASRARLLQVATATLALIGIATLLVSLGSSAAAGQLAAQPDPAQPPTPSATPTAAPQVGGQLGSLFSTIPEGRTLPWPNLCLEDVQPKLILTASTTVAPSEVGWLVTGARPGTLVSLTLTSIKDETVTFRDSRQPSGACGVGGTFPVPPVAPGEASAANFVLISGTRNNGEPFQLFDAVVGIPSTQPRPTATPVPTRPEPPTDFRATIINTHTARLDWTDNSNNEKGFVITGAGQEWTADANARTLTVGAGRDFNPIVCFALWAFNDVGRSFGGLECLTVPRETLR